jgi:hypothetical protein
MLLIDFPDMIVLKSKRSDKGKPGENRGRKAMGLKLSLDSYDSQAAEIVDTIYVRVSEAWAFQTFLFKEWDSCPGV